MTARARRSAGFILAVVACSGFAGCQGCGQLADGLGRAFALLALIFVAVLGAVFLAYLVVLVTALVMFVRRAVGAAPWSAAPIVVSASACALHGALLALVPSSSKLLPLYLVLAWSSAVPVALLFASAYAVVAARRPSARVPLALLCVAPVVLALVGGAALARRHQPLDPRALPGRMIDLAETTIHACGLWSSGRVVCVGANYDGQRGHGHERHQPAPSLVEGLDDATSIAVAHGLSCATRRRGDAVCWGGRERLPVPGSPLSPWRVPGSEGVVALAITESLVVGLRADGTTFGFPEALPARLARARAISATSSAAGSRVCVVDPAGTVACAETKTGAEGGPLEVREMAGIAGAVRVAVHPSGSGGCAVLSSGRAACFHRDGSAMRPLSVEDATDVAALDDASGASYCFHRRSGAITCFADLAWKPARSEPLTTTGAFRTAGANVCALERDGPIRCVAINGGMTRNLAELLAWASPQ